MIEVHIPGYKDLKIKNVVFDFNGTIAEDGAIKEETKDNIIKLSKLGLKLYVATADTHGSARSQCEGLPIDIKIFQQDDATLSKKNIIEELNKEVTVAIGNGRNDSDMLKESILSMAIIGKEGAFCGSIMEADIVVQDINHAIELLLYPKRLIATLRG